MGNVPLEPGVHDGFHDGWIVKLLRFIDLMPARYTSGVVMRKMLMVIVDGPDNIAFIYLHVIDIVK